MGKIQKRRCISIQPSVFARLAFHVREEKASDPESKAACSAVVEAALAEYLDARGVPHDPEVEAIKARHSEPEPHPMDDLPAQFTI